MRVKFWLIISEEEDVKVRRRTPMHGDLREGEIAIPMTVNVPASWFDHRSTVIELALPQREQPAITVEAGSTDEWQIPEGMLDAYGLDSDEEAQP